jgi:hypothetical protein
MPATSLLAAARRLAVDAAVKRSGVVAGGRVGLWVNGRWGRHVALDCREIGLP